MIGYKGFDRNFQCRGFQYEVGKTFTFDGKIKVCKRGFHFQTDPVSVLNFYPPIGSRFALVEATGNIDEYFWTPSVKCTDKLTIIKELSLEELILKDDGILSLQRIVNPVRANVLPYSNAFTDVTESVSFSCGRHSIAVAGGSRSVAIVTADNSIAVATGWGSIAKGTLGCWLVLAEWNNEGIADVQVLNVDGVKIKPDTFYALKDGKPVEVSPYD